MIQLKGKCGMDRGLNGDAPNLIGCALQMQSLRQRLSILAKHDCTVLIHGESGTGKELVARHIHLAGPRAHGPFVIADCTALPETLIASQLFGHVKGAFTDAKQATLGLFRAAHGGTLLIDEIGEMQLCTQAKLLRCIQEHSVVPVGAVDPIHVDVRVLAATHRDLREMVARGSFREDLYYRLDVVRTDVPPLREHPSDIVLLAEHFLEEQAALSGTSVKTLSAEAGAALESYGWPGNVRELRNAIERATILSESDRLTVGDLPERVRGSTRKRLANSSEDHCGIAPLLVVERRHLERALRATDGNQSRAAALLGVERHRFARMIRRHGLAGVVKTLRSSVTDDSLRPGRAGRSVTPALTTDRAVDTWAAAS